MSLFGKKRRETENKSTAGDRVPVIRCSICTGEQVAGFKDKATGRVEEVMLIRSERDLARFREKYRIEGKIEKIY